VVLLELTRVLALVPTQLSVLEPNKYNTLVGGAVHELIE
jgi:hypothetical protein